MPTLKGSKKSALVKLILFQLVRKAPKQHQEVLQLSEVCAGIAGTFDAYPQNMNIFYNIPYTDRERVFNFRLHDHTTDSLLACTQSVQLVDLASLRFYSLAS